MFKATKYGNKEEWVLIKNFERAYELYNPFFTVLGWDL